MVDPSAIAGVRWVHVFEEDTAQGQVYKPDSGPIPLSRRPREAMTLHPDGSATIEAGGSDDRPVGKPARWRSTPGGLIVEAGGSTELHITHLSSDRLVVAPARG